MPIRAYLVLHRTLLLWCSVLALFFPFISILVNTSDNGLDFGVFWNHFCGCAPAKGDAVALLYISTASALVIGVLLSFGNRAAMAFAGTARVSGLGNGISYTLTRPMRRSTVLLAPVFIAFSAIAILPALGFAAILGWMHLVHAPAVAFFPKAMRLVPDASVLPPTASLLSLFVAAHAVPIYLGSISIGFFAYVLFYSQRWLMLSRHSWVRIMAVFQTMTLFLVPFPTLRWLGPEATSWLFLTPPHQLLAWHPSALLLLVHYAVPAALLYGSWRTLKSADF